MRPHGLVNNQLIQPVPHNFNVHRQKVIAHTLVVFQLRGLGSVRSASNASTFSSSLLVR